MNFAERVQLFLKRQSVQELIEERKAHFAASYAEAKRTFGGIGPN